MTVVAVTAPPLMKSRASHKARLLVSPVLGEVGFSSGSLAVTVSDLAISLVSVLIGKILAAVFAVPILDVALGGPGRRLGRDVL